MFCYLNSYIDLNSTTILFKCQYYLIKIFLFWRELFIGLHANQTWQRRSSCLVNLYSWNSSFVLINNHDQWSLGSISNMILSPNWSTVDLPTGVPTMSWTCWACKAAEQEPHWRLDIQDWSVQLWTLHPLTPLFTAQQTSWLALPSTEPSPAPSTGTASAPPSSCPRYSALCVASLWSRVQAWKSSLHVLQPDCSIVPVHHL